MLNKQRGFIHATGWQIAWLLAVVGVAGWALVEGVLWAARHLSIGYVA